MKRGNLKTLRAPLTVEENLQKRQVAVPSRSGKKATFGVSYLECSIVFIIRFDSTRQSFLLPLITKVVTLTASAHERLAALLLVIES